MFLMGIKRKEHLAIIIVIKREGEITRKKVFNLFKLNQLHFLSKDEILIINYQNDISNSF
jgi:hypothetical protein